MVAPQCWSRSARIGSLELVFTPHVTSVPLNAFLTVSTVPDCACVSAGTRRPWKLDHFYHVSSRLPGLEGKPGWIVSRVGLGSPGARNLLESLKKPRQFRQFVSLTSLRLLISGI